MFNQVLVQWDDAGFTVLHRPGFRRNAERVRSIALNYIDAPQLRYLADPSPAIRAKPRNPASRRVIGRSGIAGPQRRFEYHSLFFERERLRLA